MKILVLTLLFFSIFLCTKSSNDYDGSELLANSRVQDGLKPLVKFVHFFLHKIVQPKKIDVFLKRANVTDYDSLQNYFKERNWKTIVKDMSKVYLGFAIITLIGVFTILGLLISAFITCCCRCCCSKKPKFDKGGKDTCKRTCCGFVLFIIALFCAGLCVVGALAGTHLAKELKSENILNDFENSSNIINFYISRTKSNLTTTIVVTINDTEINVTNQLKKFPNTVFENFDNNIGNVNDNLNYMLYISNRTELKQSYGSLTNNSKAYNKTLYDLQEYLNNLEKTINDSCSSLSKDCKEIWKEFKELKPTANFENLSEYILPAVTNLKDLKTNISHLLMYKIFFS